MTSLFHLLTTKGLLGPKLVVSAAANAKVLDGVRTSAGSGFDVVELEKSSRVTATTVTRDERAAGPVALENGPAN